MAFRKIIEKLNAYYARLEQGKAKKIKPGDVKKVIAKLSAKQEKVVDALGTTKSKSRKERLARKLLIADEHLKRAKWLLEKLRSRQSK